MPTPEYVPSSLLDATRHFADLDVSTRFMARLRWPKGIACPDCGGKEHSYITTRRTWACKGCKKRFTVKVGTVMEDSPIGLDKWLVAMWLLADCKNGISSHEVARHLSVSQKSAWFLMHRIRLAMQRGSWEKFDGPTEADRVEWGYETTTHPRPTRRRQYPGAVPRHSSARGHYHPGAGRRSGGAP